MATYVDTHTPEISLCLTVKEGRKIGRGLSILVRSVISILSGGVCGAKQPELPFRNSPTSPAKLDASRSATSNGNPLRRGPLLADIVECGLSSHILTFLEREER